MNIGDKINRWTLLEKINKSGRVYYKCQCECGTIKEVRADHLKSGSSKSCGCLQKEKVKNNYIDLTGQHFGKWNVIRKTETPNTTTNRGTFWECQCECGTIKIVSGHSLKNGTSKSCGCIKSFGEEKIAKILTNNNINFAREFSFSDCTSVLGYRCYFDFIIYVNNSFLLLEYQGRQHYEDDNWNWISPKENDKIKEEYCRSKGIPLIKIPYWDYEKIDWNYIKEKCKI